MALINVGTVPNDPAADTLRGAFIKVNGLFPSATELALGGVTALADNGSGGFTLDCNSFFCDINSTTNGGAFIVFDDSFSVSMLELNPDTGIFLRSGTSMDGGIIHLGVDGQDALTVDGRQGIVRVVGSTLTLDSASTIVGEGLVYLQSATNDGVIIGSTTNPNFFQIFPDDENITVNGEILVTAIRCDEYLDANDNQMLFAVGLGINELTAQADILITCGQAGPATITLGGNGLSMAVISTVDQTVTLGSNGELVVDSDSGTINLESNVQLNNSSNLFLTGGCTLTYSNIPPNSLLFNNSFGDEVIGDSNVTYDGTNVIVPGLRNSGDTVLAAGGAGQNYRPAGLISSAFADAGNSGTTNTALFAPQVSASLLQNNGDLVSVFFSLKIVGSATATSQVRVYFGVIGTNIIFDSGALGLAGNGVWQGQVVLARSGTTTGRASVSLLTPGAALADYTAETDLTGLDFTVDTPITISGTRAGVGAATNDITFKHGHATYCPA